MSKNIQLSALFVATVLVAGLIAVGFSDEAFAKKPETKKILIHVKDVTGNPVSGALCSTFVGFNFDFVEGNNGGVVQLTVSADKETVNVVCIDTIPLTVNDVMIGVELKDNGTTVLLSTLTQP